ncbi:MAG TPA: tetratricopeptide repeat protein [Ktedonobacterales bacterium]|nr:tetratricopeptide repeat protein [Ktedonobacterales bacterium]
MTEPSSHPNNAITGEGPSTGRKQRYPRPWWIRIPRFLLTVYGVATLFFYIWLIANAVSEHILQAKYRIFFGMPTIDIAGLLVVGCIWAIWDVIREWIAEDRRQKAEGRVPFAVRAERDWRNNLEKARNKGDQLAEGKALGNIGFWLNGQERHAEAEEYLTQALALARSAGDRFEEERYLGYLAECAIGRGNLDEAEALYRESLAVALRLTPENMPSPRATDETDVIDEIAATYSLLGQFLIEERGKRLEGLQMLAEAETRYREESRLHERAAQAHRFETRRLDRWLQGRSLGRAEEVHDLRRQYGDDGG